MTWFHVESISLDLSLYGGHSITLLYSGAAVHCRCVFLPCSFLCTRVHAKAYVHKQLSCTQTYTLVLGQMHLLSCAGEIWIFYDE